MRISEQTLYESETEIRPNRYVALALAVLSFFIIGMMLFNELGIFLVVKERMRIGAFSALIVLEIPLFAAGTDAGLRNTKTKYLMIICTGVVSAILCVFLNFHATLVLLLPILLAAQYPSRTMSRIAIFCSLFCAFFAPVVGYLAGTWDTAFIEQLVMISGRAVFDIPVSEQMPAGTALAQIILYLSMPHTMIILAFYPLSSSIARSGEARLKNQIQVLHMSESDTLTGLLNRLSYEKALNREPSPEAGTVAIVYLDANDLHRLNNELGHSEGDRMLICVAECLRKAFGDESVYRTGGDEFISILYDIPLSEVRDHMELVRTEVEQKGYSFSMGIEYAQLPCTLPPLIFAAEAKMLIDKKHYHIYR